MTHNYSLHTKIGRYVMPLFVIFIFSSCLSTTPKTYSIVEVVDMDYRFSNSLLAGFCKENKVDTEMVFQWQNHWVIYDKSGNTEKLTQRLEKQFPRLVLKVYKTPFYTFNRQQYTGEFPSSDWKHIIMTANLVKDTVKQHEYMEYHRTQFEKWPELSKGFAKANFQQVLVFRNGRQLMLVISIPKGKTLAELNPKTTEDNPRVNEWNKIMSQYQEGIEDAPKGSTWVMFSSLH